MTETEKCCCCEEAPAQTTAKTTTGATAPLGAYVCYCNKVTEEDIKNAIVSGGAKTIQQVIDITGANVICNCKVNNPKGTCCYPDIAAVFNKYFKG